ncbi:hypothetical protein DPMN_055702 [Dreissena polymorpha]|uniref:Carboxylesterase type B domain-containing protein n=1 Tax=Dreissena polymorpha TaxID=45954 RepID=A0A9D4CQF1_DREPO|nr:hypothetical protein DPMN_055702 [Dreissena polymorpha]
MGKLLDFEYTDWQRPNDSATLLFSLLSMSNDVGFFYPAVSTVKWHAILRKGKTYGPRSTGNYTEEERRLPRGMVTMWTNFAKSGDARRFTNATWAKYDLNSQSSLQFTNQGALPGSRFEARRMHLWSDLIPTIALMETPQAQGTGTVRVT